MLVAIAAAKGAPRGVVLAGLAILLLAALSNVVFGTYHAGVEWGFWQGPTDCTGPGRQSRQGRQPVRQSRQGEGVRCDEVQFRFLGISLAGYNALISVLMAAIAAWGMARTAKRA